MATRIERSGYGQAYVVTEEIERVVGLLNGGPPDEWVILTRAKEGKKHAVKPSEIVGLWEVDDAEPPEG